MHDFLCVSDSRLAEEAETNQQQQSMVKVCPTPLKKLFFMQSPTERSGAETATKSADLSTLAQQRQRIAAQLAELEAQEQALRDKVSNHDMLSNRGFTRYRSETPEWCTTCKSRPCACSAPCRSPSGAMAYPGTRSEAAFICSSLCRRTPAGQLQQGCSSSPCTGRFWCRGMCLALQRPWCMVLRSRASDLRWDTG